MKKEIFFFFLAIFSTPAFAQQSGIGCAVSGLKTIYDRDYLSRHLEEKNIPQIGGRIEFAYLAKTDTLFIGRYKAIGIEFYNPIYDSANIGNEFGTRHNTIITKTSFNFSARFGFEIPQHWNEFLMINCGLGIGILEERMHFRIDSLGPNYQIVNYKLTENGQVISVNMKPGETTDYHTGFYPEFFANVFYEFEHFSLFGAYTFKYIATNHMFSALFQHSINVGIFYPIKKH